MKDSDLIKLAKQNIAAGKRFAIKVIIGISIIFTFLVSIFSVWIYYKNYIKEYERKYKNSCYIYSDLNIIKQYKWSDYQKTYTDVIFDIVGSEMKLGKVEFEIGEKSYKPHNIYVADTSDYYDLFGNLSDLKVRSNTEMIEDKYFIYGKNCASSGSVIVDDYLLSVLGITDYDNVINKELNIKYDGKTIISGYVITGIFDVKMYDDTECKKYHDYHYEHIYLNLMDTEKYSTYGNNRYYFSSFMDLIKSYEYSSDFIFANESVEYEKYDCYIPGSAYEVCIIIWFMNNFGKGLLILFSIMAVATIYSICYYLKSFYMRNQKYMIMLHNIGMTQKNIKKLHNIELLIMICRAILVSVYLSVLILSGFSYITNKYLSIGYSFNVTGILAGISIGVVVMFILKFVVQRRERNQNNSAT